MKINKRNFKLLLEDGKFKCSIDIPKGKKGRYLWLYTYNKKYDESLSTNGCDEYKYHFCFQIPNVITIDTAHTGKRIFNTRLFLTRFFKKDYHVYSSGDNVQSQC